MTYSEALQQYLQIPGAEVNTTEGQNAFNAWAGERGGFRPDPTILDGHPDILDQFYAAKQTNPSLTPEVFVEEWANANPADTRLDDPVFTDKMDLVVDAEPVAYEKSIWDDVVDPAIRADIEKDRERTQYSERTLSEMQPSFDATRRTIGDLQATRVDGNLYLKNNPDLVADFMAQKAAGAPHAADVDTYARTHWELYGKNEGRPSPMISQQLINEQSASRNAAAEQLGALNTELDSLRGNLGVELGQRKDAVKTQLGTLYSNLDQLTDSLRGNLGVELGQRAGAIKTQLNALYSNLDQLTETERGSLAQQISANYAALDQEVAARKQSLAAALGTMQGALTAEGVARKAALEQELLQLNEAQGPLNAAREQGAAALATAINLGLQTQRDQITAQAAQAGYVGGSTGQDMAMTRATIGARQGAAQAMADARIANASDVAGIARYGATEGRRVEDQISGGNRELSFFGATEGRGVADYGSTGVRTIADRNAADTRGITDSSAGTRFEIGRFGADTTREDAEYGAAQTRAIGDSSAGTRFEIGRFGADADRALSDYGAGATKAIGDMGATDKRGILDAEAARRLAYFDTDTARRLASLSLPSAALSTELSVRTGLENYSRTGLNNSLNLMDRFATNPNPPPTPNAPLTTPGLDGQAALAGGTGLLGMAGSFANANNWRAPTKTATTTAPVSNPAASSLKFDSLFGRTNTSLLKPEL